MSVIEHAPKECCGRNRARRTERLAFTPETSCATSENLIRLRATLCSLQVRVSTVIVQIGSWPFLSLHS
jgi:hypothetical protein